MPKSRRDLHFLSDIEEAIQRILDYTTGLTWDDYLQDSKTQDAVVRNLEIMGEAAKDLTDEFREQHPEIPWRDMSGTRDRLVHHYFGINQEIVWQIVEQDLPGLKKKIEVAIHEFPEGYT